MVLQLQFCHSQNIEHWCKLELLNIGTNLVGIQSGLITLSTFKDLIFFFISPMLAGGKANSFSKRKLSLIFSTLGAVLYFDIMALTMSSSHSESEGYSNDNVLLPEEIFTISM